MQMVSKLWVVVWQTVWGFESTDQTQVGQPLKQWRFLTMITCDPMENELLTTVAKLFLNNCCFGKGLSQWCLIVHVMVCACYTRSLCWVSLLILSGPWNLLYLFKNCILFKLLYIYHNLCLNYNYHILMFPNNNQ